MSTTLYASTILQEARSMLSEQNAKKFELRPVYSKTVDAFLRGQESAIANLANIKESNQRVTKAIYFKDKAFTINASRSNTPTGEQGGTALSTLTWSESNFAVTYNEKLFQNNEVAATEAFAKNLWNAEKSFWESLDTNVLIPFLEANKSTVNAGDGYEGTLSGGNMLIEATNASQFYNIVQAHMMMNNFSAPFMDIHSAFWESKKNYNINQGVGNNVNLSFQFNGFEHYPSNLITPESSEYISKNYIVPTNGITMVTWNNPLNRQGKVHANGRLFTSQSLFFPGVFFDVYAYETWGNTSSTGTGEITGDIQDPFIVYEYTLHRALWSQPFTESGMSPIFRYDIQKLIDPNA